MQVLLLWCYHGSGSARIALEWHELPWDCRDTATCVARLCHDAAKWHGSDSSAMQPPWHCHGMAVALIELVLDVDTNHERTEATRRS